MRVKELEVPSAESRRGVVVTMYHALLYFKHTWTTLWVDSVPHL